MYNYRVEYLKDEYTENIDKKCNSCSGVYICTTRCCNKKLCQFHFRFGVNDGKYMSCDSCIVYENLDTISPLGYVKEHTNVYCKEHNVLTLCNKCETEYYCNDHINNHECTEYITVEPPEFNSSDKEQKI